MFSLSSPWVYLLFPLPWIIWRYSHSLNNKFSLALKLPFFNNIKSLINQYEVSSWGINGRIIFGVIWALMLVAFSGPHWIGEPQPLAKEARNIMLVLDLSGSMDLPDMVINNQAVSRFTVVQKTAEEFVNARKNDRIGLILFGTRAYLQTPLTFDRRSVLLRLEDATVGLAGQTTSIGDALGLAVKRLQNVPSKGRIIILLTDGANNSGVLSPLKAASLAKLDGIKVYTIGLSRNNRNPLSQLFDFPGDSNLDETSLKKVAQITGGKYFRATDRKSLDKIYLTINQLEPIKQKHSTLRPKKEYYPWPLGLSFFLLLLFLFKKIYVSSKQFKLAEDRS